MSSASRHGRPDPIRTLYTILTFTDILLQGRIAKINVLRFVMRIVFVFYVFVQMGSKKYDDYCML